MKYGQEIISKCESIIDYISDILLELKDDGYNYSVRYSSGTLQLKENLPIIKVEITPISEDNTDPDETIERIKDYIESTSLDSVWMNSWSYTDRKWNKIRVLDIHFL
jgi:hypothetical protein